MAKMKLPRPSAETIAYFERIAPGPPIEARRMFGMPARFLNGHMLVCVFGDTFMLHLSESDRAECIRAGAKPFAPMGREAKAYVDVPPGTFDDRTLKEWIVRGMRYLAKLPPKLKTQPADMPAPARVTSTNGVGSRRNGAEAERAGAKTVRAGAKTVRAGAKTVRVAVKTKTKASGVGARRAGVKTKTGGVGAGPGRADVKAKANGVEAGRAGAKTKTGGAGRAAIKAKSGVGAGRASSKAKAKGATAGRTAASRAKTAPAKRKTAAGARLLRDSSERAKKPGPKSRRTRP